MARTYKGKSLAPGGGGQFARMKDALERKGYGEGSAEAITASAGRKKYGKGRFQAMAAAGRKRADRRRRPLPMPVAK
jgi:hypothetical protein